MTPAMETSALLNKKTATGQQTRNRIVAPLAAAGVVVILGLVFAAATSPRSPAYKESAPPPPSSPSRLDEVNECVSMCVGVYDGACLIAGGKFAFPSGIGGGLLLSVPSSSSSDGGNDIDYYLLSAGDNYVGYLEYGHYTLDHESALRPPDATHNCKGRNDIYYDFVGDGVWSPLRLDMEWNSADGGKSGYFLGTDDGFGCHYMKLSGKRCQEVYQDIVDRFVDGGMELDLPSADNLCE
eukprot:CAMPEP_0113552866 /NCGR_PEP_ID=MMETSP0015_2-20120614/15301_1 /TAXON_ID=2838 /ORGANISM="Odontella" /LENGTH=238 /DNA_ID=CAMNT_0000453883 /DNA_START=76 /DNA_END=793 /DNA_ORIENTATION=+ /assembly_acc=CAM_ASM_000160